MPGDGDDGDLSLTAQDPIRTFAFDPDDESAESELTEVIRIGARDGSEAYVFSAIRYAFRMESGELMVFDDMSRTVRVFDADGRFLRSGGGGGQGPGEFNGFSSVLRSGPNELVVIDQLARRAARLTPDLVGLRTSQVLADSIAERFGRTVVAVGAGDQVVVRRNVQRDPGTAQAGDTATSLVRLEMWHVAEGGNPKVLWEGPGALETMEVIPVGPGIVSGWVPVEGSRITRLAGGPESIFVSRTDLNTLEVVSQAGDATSTLGLIRAGSTTATDVSGRFEVLLFDGARVWVGMALADNDSLDDEQILLLIDPERDGVVQHVRLPSAMEPVSAWADYLVAVERDELDVPEVIVFRVGGPGRQATDPDGQR